MAYIFKTSFTPEIEPKSLEEKSLYKILTLWTNFAKYSNPTSNCLQDLTRWKPVEKTCFNYLEIGEKLTMGVDPDAESVTFWNDLMDFHPIVAKL